MEAALTTAVTQSTHGIRIAVRSLFVPEKSSMHYNQYVFAYRINILNETAEPVQLLYRQWDILDACGEKRWVNGSGVVGQQPIIEPGQEYTYVSGSVFKTPMGIMHGTYTMSGLNQAGMFEVDIPRFLLVAPHVLN